MEISQRLLCFLFLASFAFGILWGILYDLLYLLRFFLFGQTVPSHPNRSHFGIFARAFMFLEDFLFILFGGIGLMLLLYLVNDGVFRLWGPCGMFAGFYVYRVTVGALFLRICESLIRCFCRLLSLLCRLILRPILAIGHWLYRLICHPLLRFISRKRYEKGCRRTEQIMMAFFEEADRAFADQDEVLWNN